MKNNWKKALTITALLCTLCTSLAFGASDGKKMKFSGLITGRDGEDLTVKTLKGSTNVVVVLTDTTKVQIPKGLFKFRHSEEAVTTLIPGLKIEVEGTGTETRVVAKNINLDKDDLLMAEMIQAGLDPTKQQQQTNMANIAENKEGVEANKEGVASNKQQGQANAAGIAANQQGISANQADIASNTKRFSELSEYDTTAKATVYFTSGSNTISDSDKDALKLLASTAVGTKGYIIQVKGYADTTGNAAMNQQLSMDRAHAVIAYLIQNCSVPVRHIVAPGAMGTADPAAPNETPDGRAENRRVDVKVLVNRGLAGSSSSGN